MAALWPGSSALPLLLVITAAVPGHTGCCGLGPGSTALPPLLIITSVIAFHAGCCRPCWLLQVGAKLSCLTFVSWLSHACCFLPCTELAPKQLLLTVRAFSQLRFNPGKDWLLAFLGTVEKEQVRRSWVAVVEGRGV